MREVRLPRRVIDGDFGGWLGDAMRARRLTQRMVALRSGVDHSTISRLRRSRREPQLSTAIALIRLLEPQPLEPEGGDAEAAVPPPLPPVLVEDR